MKRETIMGALEVIQDRVDGMGFKDHNEFDLHMREEIADYIGSLLNGPTDEEWFAAIQDTIDQEKQEKKRMLAVLDQVHDKVGDDMFEDITGALVVSDWPFDYKITDKPLGELQDQDEYEHIEGVYVNQTTNGGYTGDEYAGTCSIKIGENEYFQFNYSM